MRLVETALSFGVTHFDTAPGYGLGTSESALAKALGSKIKEVTISTKVGLPRPTGTESRILAGYLLRPILKRFPNFKKGLIKATSGQESRSDFSLRLIEASLEQSLLELGRDYVDLLFLHEAMVADVTPEILEFLTSRKSAGRIGKYGICSGASWIDFDQGSLGPDWSMQFCWDSGLLKSGSLIPVGNDTFVHGVVRDLTNSESDLRLRRELDRVLEQEPSFSRNNQNAEVILILSAVLAALPDTTVVYSTTSAKRLSAVLDHLKDDQIIKLGQTFLTQYRS